jgi:peptidoglycan/LPS O-acetylase OafA/YrhL
MHNPLQSAVASSHSYRPDIDGLRAVAVLAVISYHLGFKSTGGGFVGVDIFFVISGYLIAGNIARDLARGSFSLLGFYERRVRRILPALTVMVLGVALAAWFLLSPDDLVAFAKSAASVAAFSSNIFFAADPVSGGYFTPPAYPKPLLHTWSLAVEEQFYFLFPVLMFLIARFSRKRTSLVLGVLALASLGLSLWQVRYQPTAAFYLLPDRAWEFLIGALLTASAVKPLSNRLLRELAALVGLAGIAYAIFTYTPVALFPGWSAFWPCAGAALLLYSGQPSASQPRAGQPTLVARLLSLPPVVSVGAISYSLYLWHWPLIVFARYLRQAADWEDFYHHELVEILFLTFALAILSHQLVELPFRRRPYRGSPARTVGIGFAVSGLVGLGAMALILGKGLPHRFSPATQHLIALNEARADDFSYLGACANYKVDAHQFSDLDFCHSTPAARHNVLFWGDSHTQQLSGVINELPAEPAMQGHGVVFAVSVGCAVAGDLNVTKPGYHCQSFARFALQRALADDIDEVFIETLPWWYLADGALCVSENDRCRRPLNAGEATDRVMDDLSQLIRTLREHGKRVIVGLPFPTYDRDIPKYEISVAILAPIAHPEAPFTHTPAEFYDRMSKVITDAGGEVYDPRRSLCNGNRCLYQIDGVSIYKDDDHIAGSRAYLLKPGLLASVAPKPSPAPAAPRS